MTQTALALEPQTQPDQLIAEHGALVRRLARKVHSSAGASVDLEELVQTGMMALVIAARVFVQRGEASFATYATMRVRGAMIDVLRSSATINRGAMRRRKAMKATETALEGKLGRTPSPGEVASELGLSAAGYRSAVDAAQPVYLEALDAVYSDRSSVFASEDPNAFEQLEHEGLRDALAGAIARLPRRESLVLQLYFVEELTLDEIGQTMDVAGEAGAGVGVMSSGQACGRAHDRRRRCARRGPPTGITMTIKHVLPIAIALSVCAPAARAGVFTDDLSRCLVAKTTPADRTALVRFMFAAVSANPSVSDLVSMYSAKRDELTAGFARLTERLVLTDCRTQSVAALKNEGTGVFEASFNVLGQIAGRGLMNDPASTVVLQGVGKKMDKAKFEALAREAGVPTKQPSS